MKLLRFIKKYIKLAIEVVIPLLIFYVKKHGVISLLNNNSRNGRQRVQVFGP